MIENAPSPYTYIFIKLKTQSYFLLTVYSTVAHSGFFLGGGGGEHVRVSILKYIYIYLYSVFQKFGAKVKRDKIKKKRERENLRVGETGS